MRKRSIGLFFLVLVFFFVGCDEGNKTYSNEIKDGWINVDNNWTDSDGAFLGYVANESNNHLDLSWYTDPEDTNTMIMGFIEEYTYSNGKLKGKYTSFQNPNLDEYDINITFSYAAPSLTAVIVADGILGNKTLNLIPAP